MTGASVPYRIRQNKAVDRLAFLEILEICNRLYKIPQYTYIGFGGSSLEDFKIIHNRLGIDKLISLEINGNLFNRQKFNLPVRNISLMNTSSAAFIRTLELDGPTIIWLDYVKPSDLSIQLSEVSKVLGEMSAGDIIKVTLNANASALYNKQNADTEIEIQRYRRERLERILGVLPIYTRLPDFNAKIYPRYLIKLLIDRMISATMSNSSGKVFLPLGAFIYADGQIMITVTGIVLKRGKKSRFIESTRIKDWPFFYSRNRKVFNISIPDLTPKEKIYIDSMLPGTPPHAIEAKLKFHFGNSTSESKNLLKAYRSFYRQSVYFSQVSI